MRVAGLIVLALLSPAFVFAAELININTANATLLDTLPGIGPSKAAAIIDYRTQHGPFAAKGDIQNVSGIGPSTYANISPLITVDDTSTSNASDSTASSTPSNTASTTTTTNSSSSGPAEYLPIPVLQILTADTRTVSSGADTAFTAVIYDSKGNKRDDAMVTYAFGDGMRKTGASVFHRYYDPGEYLAVVRATTSDGGNVQKGVVVTVKDANIKISSVSPRGITLANSDSRTLDLSLWRLSMGGQEFKIPEDTQILAGHTTLFPSQVIELSVADAAFLLYPSGEVAAMYGVAPAPVAVQPSPSVMSYEQVQKVESIISQGDVPVHEEAVIAPAPVSNKETGAGATLSPPKLSVGAPTSPTLVVGAPISNIGADVGAAPTSRFSGIFKSPWTLGFLGTVLLAGSAFIFL